MEPSIFDLMQRVRSHPDFIGGAIFVTHDVPEGKRLPADWNQKWLTDRLCEHGNEILIDLCTETSK